MLKLKRLLKEVSPAIKWKKEKYISSGWDFNVFLLDNKYLVRIPKNQDATKRAPIDFCLLKILNNTANFYIPKPIYLNKKNQTAVYKAVTGKMITVNSYKKMTSRSKEKFARDLAEFLLTLHSVPVKKIHRCNLPINGLKHSSRIIYKEISTIRPYLNKMQNLGLDDFLRKRKSALKPNKLVLTHGDLNSDHIFLNNQRLGIIDFSDASISDPAVDFAGLLSYGFDFVNQVLKYYDSKHSESLNARAKIYQQDIAIKILATALKGSKKISVKEAKKLFEARIVKNESLPVN
ncbi:phosphotransferase [Candidatus Falkowbacteria bacterium]|nr:phosphotransferase [Candidatus Falkowbacteria bacterium]